MGDKYRILVIGNNAAKSSQLFEKLQLSYPGNNCIEMEQARLEFNAYPDLNLFNRFQETQLDDSIRQSTGDTTDGGGVPLFLILISQTEIFSNDMKEMLIDIPQFIYFKSENYFWNHAAVLFSFEDNECNYRKEISNSIKGNAGIGEVVDKAGGRYTWMSNSNPMEEVQKEILFLCRKVEKVQVRGTRTSSIGFNFLVFFMVLLLISIIIAIAVLIGSGIYIVLNKNGTI